MMNGNTGWSLRTTGGTFLEKVVGCEMMLGKAGDLVTRGHQGSL